CSAEDQDGAGPAVRDKNLVVNGIQKDLHRQAQSRSRSLDNPHWNGVTARCAREYLDRRLDKLSFGKSKFGRSLRRDTRCVYAAREIGNGGVGVYFTRLHLMVGVMIGNKYFIVLRVNVDPVRIREPGLRSLDNAQRFLLARGATP